jgi:Leucine-rich repeat (LRR) protein
MRRIILLLSFVLLGSMVVSSKSIEPSPYIPAEERAVLIALYNATNGDNWYDNSGWKTPPLHADGFAVPGTEHTWFGITVTGLRVTSIFLPDNDLDGSIPAELRYLLRLEYLYLDSNQLSGSIPPELGSLSNLTALFLNSNQLSGSIPPELGNLGNLEYLLLSFNRLSGNIPPELGNLGNLEDLVLDFNQLSGSIPPELGNLGNLEDLSLGFNRLSGSIPPELGNLGNLEDLWLGQNQLSGSIPTSLMNLTYLGMFGIRGNCLSTNAPDLRTWLNNFDREWESHQCNPPFGSFDTPVDGSTAAGSISFTGWALDESGVTGVKIYREQNNQLVLVGEASFVEGARPDVAAAYPGYPNKTKAGWGYMMLTNFLPGGGNGSFVMHAIASNAFGKTTTLGTKTITCDNANAVKPFGAIDTPTQGGAASGGKFVNWGWVLTPRPNSIPADGSTIDVWVDGVNLGHPIYNIYRTDIAGLFPGYANSNGAIGYFYLDTAAYANGVHTIQWTAKDSAGNSDGIGSRYFSIQNTGGAGASSAASAAISTENTSATVIGALKEDALKDLPIGHTTPVMARKGFVKDIEPVEIYPDDEGLTTVEIKEMERLELDFSYSTSDFSRVLGYMVSGGQLRPLPIGSTLAGGERKFYWQPGAGFIGEYRFVFIEKDRGMAKSRRDIIVKIVPKFEQK